jgi:CDP-diacylglycerol--serine O-phosphatidyltransferase
MRAPVYDLHPSNLLTYASLFAGLGAIAAARGYGSAAAAGALLALAALADTFDGRFARRFRRSERQGQLGRELDSLVDGIVFGLVPVVVLEVLPGRANELSAALWWAAACFYVLAVVTRLSFYNVEGDHAGFVGLPTPAAALIWSTCLLWSSPPWLVPALFICVGAAMIWPVAIPRPRAAGLAAFALWAVSLVTLHAARLIEWHTYSRTTP